MKRFVDQIEIHDSVLAQKIVADLEKDGEYSVYMYEGNPDLCTRSESRGCFIKIYREEKVADNVPIGYEMPDCVKPAIDC